MEELSTAASSPPARNGSQPAARLPGPTSSDSPWLQTFGTKVFEECCSPTQIGVTQCPGNILAPQAQLRPRVFQGCTALHHLNFFCTGKGAMCAERQMNSHEGCEEMSLTKGSKRDQKDQKHPQPNKKAPKQNQTNHKNQADQAHVRSRQQKAQIRRPSTEVKRGDESFQAALSAGRPGRDYILLVGWQVSHRRCNAYQYA